MRLPIYTWSNSHKTMASIYTISIALFFLLGSSKFGKFSFSDLYSNYLQTWACFWAQLWVLHIRFGLYLVQPSIWVGLLIWLGLLDYWVLFLGLDLFIHFIQALVAEFLSQAIGLDLGSSLCLLIRLRHEFRHALGLVKDCIQIQIDTTTSPNGLIHMLTTNRAFCIVFFYDDLPPEGADHTQPLYITIGCSSRQVSSVLLGNGLTQNICPLSATIALGFRPTDFGSSTQIVRVYDNMCKQVMRTLIPGIQVGLIAFLTLFQVLKVPTFFNLLLGRPWIHEARVILSSLHQKVKFIQDGRVITI